MFGSVREAQIRKEVDMASTRQIIKGCISTSNDEYQLNTTTLIRHAARNFGKQEIVSRTIDTIYRYNYEQAYYRIKKLANVLYELGVKPGDRIGVLGWNTHRYYELYFAIAGIGATLLQMNLRLTPSELIYIVNHSEPQLIFVDDAEIAVAEAIAPEASSVRGYVVMSDKKGIETKLKPVYNYEDLLERASHEFEWPMVDEKSACFACYTTGTTGNPKGVYYSHRDIYLHCLHVAVSEELSFKDSILVLAPMFHANGWCMFLIATLVGARLILPGRYRAAEMSKIIDLMVKEKVSFTNGATAVYMPMLEHIKTMKSPPDFRGLRIHCSASEPPLEMIKGFYELTGAEVMQSYGATEASPIAVNNILKPWLAEKLTEEQKWALKAKQGFPIAGVDLKIVDDQNKEIPHDGQSMGEILMRGPWIQKCYYNAPGTESQFTEDGYWKTGDVGTIDPEGYIKVTDRTKDLIKSGGEWISSIDIENHLMAHSAVIEAAVVGLHHPRWEERPLALVVLRPEERDKIGQEDILNYLRGRFAKWQLPDEIKFVDKIPKTSVGKFDKKVMREMYKDEYLS